MSGTNSTHRKKLQKKIRSGRKARLLFDAEKKEDIRPNSLQTKEANPKPAKEKQ
ncbi:MAG: hypothetical protein QXU54_00060 [Candidatus Micrarchaeia archaeon]